MVNYLLDTHALLWLYFEEERIPQRLLKEFANPTTKLIVSAISFWEISIKYQSGRLTLGNQTPQDLLNACKKNKIIVEDITTDITSTFYNLTATYHKDPFDRLLIWQAIQNNYTLVTIDKKVNLYKSEGLKTIW
jgi:PIN domain nuclease of toxin-antitoxin system